MHRPRINVRTLIAAIESAFASNPTPRLPQYSKVVMPKSPYWPHNIKSNSDPRINRHTGCPHEHARANARHRSRQ